MIEIILDGRALQVVPGTTVAAALYLGGDGSSRTSVSGERRAPPAPRRRPGHPAKFGDRRAAHEVTGHGVRH